MIKVLRIDDRLMHAQVTFGWAQSLNIKGILIISDRVAGDVAMQTSAKFAKPDSCKLWIKDLDEGIAALEKMNSFDYNTMIIVDCVDDALEICTKSKLVKYVNMGGQRSKEGRHPILDTIFVTNEDLDKLQKIENMGVEVEVRKMITDSGYKLKDVK